MKNLFLSSLLPIFYLFSLSTFANSLPKGEPTSPEAYQKGKERQQVAQILQTQQVLEHLQQEIASSDELSDKQKRKLENRFERIERKMDNMPLGNEGEEVANNHKVGKFSHMLKHKVEKKVKKVQKAKMSDNKMTTLGLILVLIGLLVALAVGELAILGWLVLIVGLVLILLAIL